ncbi:MAG: hypothetical protein LBU51_02295 [Bacteroidales bacterium]|jgi:hypothetical protein|nr:hypothetical protein [Bacteroidales bacterium]
MEKSFYIGNCGILIGLVSTPRCITSKDFFESEIEKNLSSIYRNRRADNQNNQRNEYLYNPSGYKTFGNHDLAILSLIDDYSYPNRVFHPAHGNRDTDSLFHNYEYQILTCIDTVSNSEINNISRIQTIINEKKGSVKKPIICITRIKINNLLLLGNGLLCIESIKQTLHKLNENEFPEIDLFVFDNLGSEELVIITFSKNFSSVAKFTHKMRHLTVDDLNKSDSESCSFILENKLNIESMKKEDIDWMNAHLFSSSYSLPGYNIYSDQDTDSIFDMEDNSSSVIIDFTWDIKPGHANNFENEFRKLLADNGFDEQIVSVEPFRMNNSSWNFSFNYSLLLKKSNPIDLFRVIENIRNFDLDQHHTRKLSMKMVVSDPQHEILNSTKEIVIDKHPKSFSYCEGIIFSGPELGNLRQYLEKSKVSKLLKEKILKMYNNYNSCITDPMYFPNFADLYGFLKSFIKQIKDFAENTNVESSFKFHEWLNQYVTSFEQAYYNRFHQSNRTRNMTDYNIEWNGGVQQMISPIDFIYKQILFHIGLRQYDKFVHISGFERVHVTQHTFRINMLHITYPELFASTIWKEVFNFYWRDHLEKDSSFSFFKSENFITHLKYCIERHRHFNKTNAIHQFLYDSIDSQLVNGLIADTLSYYYGYNEDYDSFSYWYWRVLQQSSMYYDKLGRLDSKIFTLFLGRTLFVRSLEDNDEKEMEKLRFNPTDTVLSELWLNSFEDTRSFVKILREIMDWSNYRELFKKCSIRLMEEDVQQHISQISMDKKDINYLSYIHSIRTQAFKIEKDNLLKCFEEGKIIYPTATNNSNLFISTLFASFLEYLRSIGGENDNSKKTHVLLRDDGGKPIVKEYENCYSKILSDPLGGIFCIDKDIQLKCFKSRTIFYRSIFDYCMKNKKEQINYFIKKSN